MSSGLYSHTTRSVGTILTAAIYNADHQNHVTNHNPSMMGGHSDNAAQMQVMSDPGDLGAESLAGSLAGELERLRFVLARIVDQADWYTAPLFNLGDVGSALSDNSVTNAKLTDMVEARVKLRAVGAGTGDPQDGTPDQLAAIYDTVAKMRSGFLFGLTLSNGSDAINDINIAAGAARDSTDVFTMATAANLTKRLDVAWTAGTGQGGLDTGAIANTTYHVWLIRRPDTGVVDALFSASATAPTMPTNYTQKRRIGSIIREAASIIPFTQNGDEFLRKVPINSVNVQDPGTAAITVAVDVPLDIVCNAIMSVALFAEPAFNTSTYMLVTSLAQTDTAPSITVHNNALIASAGNNQWDVVSLSLRTNTSAQIRYRVSASTADLFVRMTTHGWIDTRGRLS